MKRHPLCERCMELGRVEPATEVHHVVPVESGVGVGRKEALAYDPANLRALCGSCHRASHRELSKENPRANRQRAHDRARGFAAVYFGEDPPGGVFS